MELPPSLRPVEAVIVVDMQSGFLTGEHAVPAARLLLATAREITVERRGAVASEDL